MIMFIRNFFPWWDSNLDGNLRCHCTVIFMRVHMFMCNYVDGELLDDPVKGKHLISYERKYAAYLRELPFYADWFAYNMFTPFAFCGESIEYGIFDDFINMRGDITKMRPFSNVFSAVQRHIHSLICFAVFYYLSLLATPLGMMESEFQEHPFWYKIVYMFIAANSKVYYLFSRFVNHESGLIATGISFKAKDEKTAQEYNSVRCMDIQCFHWGITAKDSISGWNMRTQHWLKYYVMMRSMDRNLPKGTF